MDNAGDDGIQLDDASNGMKIQQKTVYGAALILDRTFITPWRVLRKGVLLLVLSAVVMAVGGGIPSRLRGYHGAKGLSRG